MIYESEEYVRLLYDVIKNKKRHEVYELTCKHAEAMSVHVYGDKPMYLLERTRPREESDVRAYRIDNYEPTTKAGCDKALDIVSKIFNPTLYSIRWKEQDEQVKEIKSYTLDYYPDYNSIVAFNKDVVLRKMVADPNGIIAVKPKRIPENDATKVEPIVTVYGSPNIWYRDEDHFLIFVKEETNPDKSSRESTPYFYFEYFDKNLYLEFRVYYDGTTKEIVREELKRYVTNFDEIPCWYLRGKSRDLDNGWIIYESLFSSALPHWNYAIVHESDLLGAFINHMHPQKYELAEECDYVHEYEGQRYPCMNGRVTYMVADGTSKNIVCPGCNGAGMRTVKSPYGVYQYTKQKLDMSEGSRGLQPVGYITIPTEATKMLEERTEKMIQKGMWAINMDIEEKVGENQSGVAKVIDRSAQHDTLGVFAHILFDIDINNEYYFINKYLFGVEAASSRTEEDKNLPQVNKPTTFDIASVSELINNFKIAKESGLDPNFRRTREMEILSRDLSTNPDLKEYLITLLNLDPAYGLTVDEVMAIEGRSITREDAIIHFNLKKFVDRAIIEHNNFMQMEKEEQYAILLTYAAETIQATKAQIDTNLLDEPDDTETTSDAA